MKRARSNVPTAEAPGSAAPSRRWPIRVIESWYFLVPVMTVWFHAYGLDSPYRSLAYLNIALVLLLAWERRNAWTAADCLTLAKVCCVPVLLMALHFLGDAADARELKQVRHLFAALFLALGLWQFARVGSFGRACRRPAFTLTVWAVFAYAAIQGIAVTLFLRPFGMTKNPHYLAQYCMLLLPVAAYLYHFSTPRLRVVSAASALVLATLLLHTGSRPAWLGLFCASLLFAWFQRRRRAWLPLVIAAIVAGLYLSDVGGFARRVDDLAGTIKTEERVVIWQETWALQKQSSARGWLVGHGLDSFKEDFQAYSTYHRAGIDFNAPHNYVLELLYTVGVCGFLSIAGLLYVFYRRLLALSTSVEHQALAVTMAVVLTAHLIFGSITIPFFTSYNTVVLALIGGMLLALQKRQPVQ